MGTQFSETKIQLHALKILMSLTFNNDGNRLLEKNDDFLDHLRLVVKSSEKVDFQNIADGILWRLSRKDQKKESKVGRFTQEKGVKSMSICMSKHFIVR